ncbi:hypothetical protein VNO77_22492 [Canavalia gladiata]|uniref:Uncharacterized protein n=1 Tax=Canavalia gladiata TaxID=3824 RepID=A0AAN9L5A7_CANGL
MRNHSCTSPPSRRFTRDIVQNKHARLNPRLIRARFGGLDFLWLESAFTNSVCGGCGKPKARVRIVIIGAGVPCVSSVKWLVEDSVGDLITLGTLASVGSRTWRGGSGDKPIEFAASGIAGAGDGEVVHV